MKQLLLIVIFAHLFIGTFGTVCITPTGYHIQTISIYAGDVIDRIRATYSNNQYCEVGGPLGVLKGTISFAAGQTLDAQWRVGNAVDYISLKNVQTTAFIQGGGSGGFSSRSALSQLNGFSASTTNYHSSIVVANDLTFCPPIAVSAILFLIIGDFMAALVGISYGRIKIGKKSLEGSVACFLSCFAICLLMFWHVKLGEQLAFWGALAATVTELLNPPFIDDNLSIPCVSALAIHLIALRLNIEIPNSL